MARLETGEYELEPLLVDAAAWEDGLRDVYCVVDGLGQQTAGTALLESG